MAKETLVALSCATGMSLRSTATTRGDLAADRSAWVSTLCKNLISGEEKLNNAARDKRTCRKNAAVETTHRKFTGVTCVTETASQASAKELIGGIKPWTLITGEGLYH